MSNLLEVLLGFDLKDGEGMADVQIPMSRSATSVNIDAWPTTQPRTEDEPTTTNR